MYNVSKCKRDTLILDMKMQIYSRYILKYVIKEGLNYTLIG